MQYGGGAVNARLYMSSRGWTVQGLRVLRCLRRPRIQHGRCQRPVDKYTAPKNDPPRRSWMRGIAPAVLLLLHGVAGFVAPNPSCTSSAPAAAPKGNISSSSSSSSDNIKRSSSPLRGADSIMASSSGGAAADLEIKSETACFGGRLLKCVHQSKATKTPMTFTVFLPPAAASSVVPVLYYLSGLTCTDDNFIQKAGAQRIAALRGVALVAPDTSPRGAGVAGEDEGWDFGTGAGFYVDATEAGWKENYRMYAYVTEELPAVVAASFPAVDTSKASVCGHSMGGHGALVVAFRNPDKYRSVSAFSAMCNPVECPWGKKAFSGYLGKDEAAWKEYDATELMRRDGPFPSLGKILLDQGSADNFLTAGELLPEALVKACEDKGQPCEMRMQDGYDHSYFFISSFIEDHVNMHADRLLA